MLVRAILSLILLSSSVIVRAQTPAMAGSKVLPSHACTAHFEGTLVMEPNPDGRTMSLAQPYAFVDTHCTRWDVPKYAVVDGASIPQILWSGIGGPFEGKYRNASVIHDWYCAVRRRSWQSVHLMFYDAMIASGVSKGLADLMYFGVYRGGPRWDALTRADTILSTGGTPLEVFAELNGPLANNRDVQMTASLDAQTIEAAKKFIASSNANPTDLSRLADGISQGTVAIIETTNGTTQFLYRNSVSVPFDTKTMALQPERPLPPDQSGPL